MPMYSAKKVFALTQNKASQYTQSRYLGLIYFLRLSNIQ